MLLKCYTQYVSKYGKLSSGHRTEKCPFSFQSQRRAMLKNVQTTIQLCSSHMLARLACEILQARLQQYVSWELPDVQDGFTKKAEEPEFKILKFIGPWRKQEGVRGFPGSSTQSWTQGEQGSKDGRRQQVFWAGLLVYLSGKAPPRST